MPHALQVACTAASHVSESAPTGTYGADEAGIIKAPNKAPYVPSNTRTQDNNFIHKYNVILQDLVLSLACIFVNRIGYFIH